MGPRCELGRRSDRRTNRLPGVKQRCSSGSLGRDLSRAIVPNEGVTLALNSAAIGATWQQRVSLSVPSSKAYGLVQPLSIFGEILTFQYGEIFTFCKENLHAPQTESSCSAGLPVAACRDEICFLCELLLDALDVEADDEFKLFIVPTSHQRIRIRRPRSIDDY